MPSVVEKTPQTQQQSTSANDDWTFENLAQRDKDFPTGKQEVNQSDLKVLKKKRVSNRPKLDTTLLCGPKGLEQLPMIFKNFKSKGKGHEFDDLNIMMSKLEHWAHRLFPQLTFDDFLMRLETLGTKKPVQIALERVRDERRPKSIGEEDALEEQLASTSENFTNCREKITANDEVEFDDFDFGHCQPQPSTLTPVEITPSGSTQNEASPQLTDDQRRRIDENRKRALEIRLQKKALESMTMDDDFDDHTHTGKSDQEVNSVTKVDSMLKSPTQQDSSAPAATADEDVMMSDDEILRFIAE